MSQAEIKKVSIVIPVYNEAETISEIIQAVQAAELPQGLGREIIVVDDCSTDGTGEILRKCAKKQKELKIITHQANQGKGAALRTGFRLAMGDIVIIQDADLEYDPKEYGRLLEPILGGKADVVFGSRFSGGGPHRVLYFWHTLANRFLTLCSNAFSDLNLTDMETCYKVFKRSVLAKIEVEENRFGFEPEITAKLGELARAGELSIYEIGISYYGRTYREGKKIGPKDAFHALWCILKYNTSTFARLIKYGLNGFIVAFSQLAAMVIFVKGLSLKSIFLLNSANAISIEIAIIIAFFLHSKVTWRIKNEGMLSWIKKIFYFHLATALSIVVRVALFYILSLNAVDYRLNTLLGILASMVINFSSYSRIFTKNQKPRATRGAGRLEGILAKQRANMADRLIPDSLRDGSLLDIGCGSFPLFLSRTNFKEKCGVDRVISNENIKKAKGKRLTIARFNILDSENFPFPTAKFNVITMLAVFEHIEPNDLPHFLKNTRRLISPGGQLVMTVPAGWSDRLLRLMAGLGLVSAEEISEHKDLYNRKKIAAILRRAGFSEKKIRTGYFELGANIWVVAKK